MGKRTGIMLAYPLEEKRLLKWTPPYIIQPKLDGERCRCLWRDGHSILVSSEENVILSVPHINEELDSLPSELKVELDGELYVHGLSFQEIESRVNRTVNMHGDAGVIEYHIFDYVSDKPQLERTEWLAGWKYVIQNRKHLFVVESWMTSAISEIYRHFGIFLDEEYEGLIVRHFALKYVRKRTTAMLKFKPKKFDTYKIVGLEEEISQEGYPKSRLGAFVVEKDGQQFKVAGSIPHEEKLRLWHEGPSVIGKWLGVGYQRTSDSGVPVFAVPVKPLNISDNAL